jgi:hypothetical protein
MLEVLLDYQQFNAAEYTAMFIVCALGAIVLATISQDHAAALVAFPAALVGAYVACVIIGDYFDSDLIPSRLESIVIASAIGMTVAVFAVLVAYRWLSER